MLGSLKSPSQFSLEDLLKAEIMLYISNSKDGYDNLASCKKTGWWYFYVDNQKTFFGPFSTKRKAESEYAKSSYNVI